MIPQHHFIRFRFVLVLTMVLILTPLWFPTELRAVHAQNGPCTTDGGQPIQPSGPGWALGLNFNHPPSTVNTIGCVASIAPGQPNKVNYRTIICNVVNNSQNVAVGNGTVPFDGNLWIECPAIGKGVVVQDTFLVRGRAAFSTPGTAFTLANHQDFGVQMDITGSGAVINGLRVTLHSRYGQNLFTNNDPTTPMSSGTNVLESGMNQQTGRHAVNGSLLQPLAPVTPFNFDYGKPITIGGPGQNWTLYEILIDPPGRCCNTQ